MSNPFANWSTADVAAYNARGEAKRPEMTANEAVRESALHDEIEKECKRRGFYYVHSRMDRRTTQAKGVVDFIIAAPGGITYWIEAKGAKTKVTVEQAGALHWLAMLGQRTAIVRSFKEFLKVVNENPIPGLGSLTKRIQCENQPK